jgi:hypothetical protein
MIKFKNILSQILLEAPNGSINKRLKDAIINRNPVSFYYNGPKGEVLPGRRIRAELVVMGLTKKGNLVVRGWVQPPSTSKKGFAKHGWRTFIVGRMNNVQVLKDEQFDTKRPEYKEGDDRSMTVTYVTSDWTKTPEPPKPEVKPSKTVDVSKPEQKPTPVPKPTTEPKPEPEELPQPKPEVKPEPTPQDNTQDVSSKELYDKKKSEWIDKQKEVGGNLSPGQGTRERFKKEVEKELPQPKPDVKPSKTPEGEEDENLQESLKRIKRLMFS